MTKKELKELLKQKKGYLKKGKPWLSDKFNVEEDLVREIVKELLAESNNAIVVTEKTKFEELKAKTLSIHDKIEDIRKFANYGTNNITKPGTYWVTGCSHAPWQNKAMYNAVYNYLSKEVKLEGIVLAGDVIDANSLSAHDRGNIALPGVTLEWEYKESNKFLNEIDDISKDINKIFLYGNHEDRYNRTIRNVDINKYGSALKSPIEGLKLYERGYKVFTDWKNDVIHIGKHLDINHGEFCNVHTAKKTIDTYRKSTLYFHTHRFQIFMEGMNAGFNMGFGGDINAPIFGYATRAMKNSWVNGSALVTLDENGYYHVQPLLFIKDKLIINGKQY